MSTNGEDGATANDSPEMRQVVSFIKSHPGELAQHEGGRCLLALMAIAPRFQLPLNTMLLDRSLETGDPRVDEDGVHSIRQCGQVGCATTCELVFDIRRSLIDAQANDTAAHDCINLNNI